MDYCFRMSPTDKKLAIDPVARAFAEAEKGPTLSDDDRGVLTEAATHPKWLRMSRGEAFEGLVCNDDGG